MQILKERKRGRRDVQGASEGAICMSAKEGRVAYGGQGREEVVYRVRARGGGWTCRAKNRGEVIAQGRGICKGVIANGAPTGGQSA